LFSRTSGAFLASIGAAILKKVAAEGQKSSYLAQRLIVIFNSPHERTLQATIAAEFSQYGHNRSL
jgi:hypothetical protein